MIDLKENKFQKNIQILHKIWPGRFCWLQSLIVHNFWNLLLLIVDYHFVVDIMFDNKKQNTKNLNSKTSINCQIMFATRFEGQ